LIPSPPRSFFVWRTAQLRLIQSCMTCKSFATEFRPAVCPASPSASPKADSAGISLDNLLLICYYLKCGELRPHRPLGMNTKLFRICTYTKTSSRSIPIRGPLHPLLNSQDSRVPPCALLVPSQASSRPPREFCIENYRAIRRPS